MLIGRQLDSYLSDANRFIGISSKIAKMPTIPKLYIPAVFLGAPNFGSIDLVGLPGSLRLGRILRVGEPGLLFFIRRPMGGDNEDVFFGAIHILR